ncbi:MAG: hypothetical protein K2X35_21975 [Bryobacteraceae bacterium]|nr:hypothetical protein [Bryobacteraceae bacterium]
MRKFRFPLKRVLDWRQAQVQIEEAKLAALLVQRQNLRQRVEETTQSAAEAAAALLRLPSLPGAELQALDRFRESTVRRVAELNAQIRANEAAIEAKRRDLAAARRNAQLLEKLEKRKKDEWRAAADRELEAEAADSYLAGWVRRLNSPGLEPGLPPAPPER